MNERVLREAQNRGRDLGHKYVTSYLTDPARVCSPKRTSLIFGLSTWPTTDRILEVAEILAESWGPRLRDTFKEVIQVTNLETGETEGFVEIKEGRVRSWFSQVDPKDAQGQTSEPPGGLAHLPPNCS